MDNNTGIVFQTPQDALVKITVDCSHQTADMLLGTAKPSGSASLAECNQLIAEKIFSCVLNESAHGNKMFSLEDYQLVYVTVTDSGVSIKAIHSNLGSIITKCSFGTFPPASIGVNVAEFLSMEACRSGFGNLPMSFEGLYGTEFFSIFLNSVPLTEEEAWAKQATETRLVMDLYNSHPGYKLDSCYGVVHLALRETTVPGTDYYVGPFIQKHELPSDTTTNAAPVYSITEDGVKFLQCAVPHEDPFLCEPELLNREGREKWLREHLENAKTETEAYFALRSLDSHSHKFVRSLIRSKAIDRALNLVHDESRRNSCEKILLQFR